MRKMNKVFAIIMVVIFALNISGCAKKAAEVTPVADTVATTEAAVAQDTTATTTEEPAALADPRDKYEAFDLGGRTIKVSAWWEVVAHDAMAEPDPATALPETIAKYENLKRVEQKYNCKIEFVNTPWDQLSAQLTTSVMAGQPYADVVYLPAQFSITAVANDLLLPLSEVTSPNSDVYTDKVAVQMPGKMLGQEVGINAVGVPVNGVLMGYNKTMMKELGLQDPQELYKADPKSWTWDKFLEYAKAATKDTNADGVMDTYGVSGFVNNIVQNLVIANGGTMFDDVNKVQTLDDPKTMEAFEFSNKIYNVDKVVKIAQGDLWNWDANFNGYKDGTSLMFPAYSWMLGDAKTTLAFDYGVVPFPVGPQGTPDATYGSSYDMFSIPKGTQDPQKVYQVLEELLWFFGADAQTIRDDSTYEWLGTLLQTQEDIDMFVETSRNTGKLDLSGVVPNYPLGTIVGDFVTGGKTVAQTVEANKQVAQDAIDTLMNSKPAQ